MALTLTLDERVEAYKRAFPNLRASWPWMRMEQGHQCLYAVWVIGAVYGNDTAYHGAFPRGLMKRLMALYPDVQTTLHVFSGSLPPGPYVRLDVKRDGLVDPDVLGSVYDAETLFASKFELIVGDPPYTTADAKIYGTAPVNRRRAIGALASVAERAAHLAWLDVQWPIHRKTQWLTVGRIMVQRSTNHQVRVLTLFERQ